MNKSPFLMKGTIKILKLKRIIHVMCSLLVVTMFLSMIIIVDGIKLKDGGPGTIKLPLDDYYDNSDRIALPFSVREEGQWSRNSIDHFPISLPALHRLVIEEAAFYQFLKKTFKDIPHPNDPEASQLDKLIHRFLRRYEIEAVGGLQRWSQVTGKPFTILATLNHPHLILQMLRRIVYEFLRIYPLLEQKSKAMPKFNEKDWPTQQDVHYFSSLLTHIQYFYDYDVNKFAGGVMGKNVITGVNLSSVMAIEMGFVAGQQRLYSSAIDWIAYALKESKENGGMDPKNVKKALLKAIKDHDENLDLINNEIQSTFTCKIETIDFYENNRQTLSTIKAEVKKMIISDGKQNTEMNIQSFMHLCTGDNWQKNEDRYLLKCWYGDAASPFSKSIRFSISPYKMELLSKSPYLVKIHDFINSKDSFQMRKDTFNCLQRLYNPVAESKDGKATLRAGMNCNLKESGHRYVEKLNRKISFVTGLKYSDSPIDVESHLPGGHFQPSTYPQRLPREHKISSFGHGVSTFLISLNTPKVGGRNAFTSLGFTDPSKMGSAMFWHNHLPDGNVDTRMRFGSCPVVLGQKWTATKWMKTYSKSDYCSLSDI